MWWPAEIVEEAVGAARTKGGPLWQRENFLEDQIRSVSRITRNGRKPDGFTGIQAAGGRLC